MQNQCDGFDDWWKSMCVVGHVCESSPVLPQCRHTSMAYSGENLDFLGLLDEVEDGTMSRFVNEMDEPVSCDLGDRDTLDMLSICDSTSLEIEGMALGSTRADLAVADDQEHVLQYCLSEVSSDTNDDKPVALPETYQVYAVQDTVMRSSQPFDSASSQLITSTAAGKTLSPKRRSRWQFSKGQRQQLDAVFKKTMYPSKWRITELSSALQVPIHTLRNRRWRLRKSHGISGDFRVRGSRTMLPDKEDSKGQMPSTTSSNQPGALDSCTKDQVCPAATFHLLKPALGLNTASVKQPTSTSMVPVSTSPASVLDLFSAHQPLLGELRHGMEGYGWDMPARLHTGWNLPAPLCWPAATAYPTTYPLAYPLSPWPQGYGLPLLSPLYPSSTSSPVVGQAFDMMDESRGSSGTIPLSYAYAPSQKAGPGLFPQATYPVYSRSSPFAAASYPAFLPSLKRPTMNEPVMSTAAAEALRSSGVIKSAGPYTSPALFSKDIQGTKCLGSSELRTISSSLMKSTNSFDTANCVTMGSVSGVPRDDGHYYRTAANASVSYPSQGVCPCHLCVNPGTAPTQPVGSQSGENECQSVFPTTVHPSFTGIASPTTLPDPPKREKESTISHQGSFSNDAHVVCKTEELAFSTDEVEGKDETEMIDVTTCTQPMKNISFTS